MKSFAVPRTFVVVGVALLLLTGAFYGLGSARASAGPVIDSSSSLAVSAVNGFGFSPNTIEQLPTNTTITLTFSNVDTSGSAHTFTIIGRQGWVIPSTYTPEQLTSLAYGSQYPHIVNANSSGTGNTNVTTFQAPGPGWYEFVCTEGGHFQSGMYGFIAFGMNLPSNLTVIAPNTGPGEAVFIIIGTIVALTVIALVLGFVIGRRKGSEFEMPPERLGYKEPEHPGPGGSVPPTGPSKP
jgi:plastocyanin